MPVHLHIIRASEFVCVDADQHLDFEASKELLHALVLACQKRGLDRAMMDIREVPVLDKPYFTVAEIAALAGVFRTAGFARHQRLAILYKVDVHGGIRNFTFFTKLRGLQVQAFNKFEDAMFWLSEQPAELHHGVEVPIQNRAKKRPAGPTVRIHPRMQRSTRGSVG